MKEYCEHYTLDCQAEKMTCEGCGYYKKSADEDFEDIGLIKEEDVNQIIYSNKKNPRIKLLFHKKFKSVSCEGFDSLRSIDIKIINKKMEELGWK